MTAENDTLLRYVRSQRAHVLGILDGLDEAALRRAVLPSGWIPLALLNHLAFDDERFWFRGVVAGEREVIEPVEQGAHDGWTLDPGVPVEEVFARYRREAALADAIIADSDLDGGPAWWPTSVFGDGFRLRTIREIVLHHVVETATHAGHLDVVRELVDGRQWIVQD
jgi:hypothetical protein